MSALIAVLSRDGRSAVPVEDLKALVRAHEEVLGPAAVTAFSVSDWAHAAVLGEPAVACRSANASSWLVGVGAAHVATEGVAKRIEDLDGQFAAAAYDAAGGSVEVGTDPLGMQGVYLAERAGRNYLSTSALALARHLRCQPEPLGAHLFLHTGNLFGPLTHWRGVRRLEPGTVRRFGAGEPVDRCYWNPQVDERVRAMSFDETVEHCAEVTVGVLGRRLRRRDALSADLTGGYDSRLVAAMLVAGGVQFGAVTSGDVDTIDVRLARRVASSRGLDWRQQRLPWSWGPDDAALRAAVGWGDGALEVLQLAETLWRQAERARHCHSLVQGGGGEHFGPYPWLQEFAHAGRTHQVNFDRLMTMRVFTPTDLHMVRGVERAGLQSYAREVLGRRAAPFGTAPNTTQLDLMYAYKSTGHFGAYRAASAAHVRAEVPCYYRDVFSAAFSVHHRWRNAHRLHRALIERLDPVMSRVETERGGPAQLVRPLTAWRFTPYYLRLGRTAVRKVLRRRAPAAVLSSQARAGYLDAVRRLRRQGTFSASTMRSGELYDPVALQAFVAQSEAPDFEGWPVLGRIATIELMLREVEGAEF